MKNPEGAKIDKIFIFCHQTLKLFALIREQVPDSGFTTGSQVYARHLHAKFGTLAVMW